MTLEKTIRCVIKVLRSCKNKTQFEGSLPWGVTAIIKSARDDKSKHVDHEGKRIDRITPPYITSCKLCGGTGLTEGDICAQCGGSGRVVVTSEITTYIKAYEPERLQ